MCFFNLTEADLPKPMQPQFILDVEKSELNIGAGLQDRVIQVGLVPLARSLKESQGHLKYVGLRRTCLYGFLKRNHGPPRAWDIFSFENPFQLPRTVFSIFK